MSKNPVPSDSSGNFRSLPLGAPGRDIMNYARDIWALADLLRAGGFSAGDWPRLMMPFFALILIESRLVRETPQLEHEFRGASREEFLAFAQSGDLASGFNVQIYFDRVRLLDICQRVGTFKTDLGQFLKDFDPETRSLLGVDANAFLDISGVISRLESSEGFDLREYVAGWARIDLVPFDNSAVTTLEEHIKRRWADVSATQAGEQYTPEDIIQLIADMAAIAYQLRQGPAPELLSVYDPTCGGGNLLYGIEDRLRSEHQLRSVETYGQEINTNLFALAKIESRFREKSTIALGNTLTNDLMPAGVKVDFVAANPPYGVDWKGLQGLILADKTGRFDAGVPNVQDGQLLFVQHIVSKLDAKGVALIILNGSPLFSGTATSGESAIRKWLLDQDLVEALVQLPANEFFNTNITTYLLVLNRNKIAERRNKVLLIDAQGLFEKLRKNMGSKNVRIAPKQRETICDLYAKFAVSDISKIVDKYSFYYRLQHLECVVSDERYGAFSSDCLELGNLLDGTLLNIAQQDDAVLVCDFDALAAGEACGDLAQREPESRKEWARRLSARFSSLEGLLVSTPDGTYYVEDEVLWLLDKDGQANPLGAAKLELKFTTQQRSGQLQAHLWARHRVTTDTECVPHDPDPVKAQAILQRWLKERVAPHVVSYRERGHSIGVEILFAEYFPQPPRYRETDSIRQDLLTSNATLALDSSIAQMLEKGELDCSNWKRYRFKNLFTVDKGKKDPSLKIVDAADFEDEAGPSASELDLLPYLSAEVMRGGKPRLFCNSGLLCTEADFLILWDGANSGECFRGKVGYVSSTMARARPRRHVDPEYGWLLLRAFEALARSATKGMNVRHVDPDFLGNLELLLPPMAVQQSIVQRTQLRLTALESELQALEQRAVLLREAHKVVVLDSVGPVGSAQRKPSH